MLKPKQPEKKVYNSEKTLFVGTSHRLLVFTSSHDISPPSAVLKQIRVRVIK